MATTTAYKEISDKGLDTNSNVDPDDPCNNYEWSVVFLLMLILASLFILLEGYTMFKRRRDLFSGFDLGKCHILTDLHELNTYVCKQILRN